MICRSCGSEVDNNLLTCPNCGDNLKVEEEKKMQNDPVIEDIGGIIWFLIGVVVPILGLVLFIVWKDDKPKNSKSSGIGALAGVGLRILGMIVFSIIMRSFTFRFYI